MYGTITPKKESIIFPPTSGWMVKPIPGAFSTYCLKKQALSVHCTPGAGFGKCGEGFIRISAFNNIENVQKAMARIREALK